MGGKTELTGMQRLFVDEYLIDLNATQAAIRAGYSIKAAAETGYKLCHKKSVEAAIARAKAARSRRTCITQDRVLRELARIAFVNPNDVIDLRTAEVKEGTTEDDLSVIAGMKVKYIPHKDYDEDGEVVIETAIEREVKLCDKLRALDMLCKHLGIYNKDEDPDGGSAESGVIELAPIMSNPGPPEAPEAEEAEPNG